VLIMHACSGICSLQDNLLWDRLTAREHLMFYGRLKNLRGAQLTAAVDAALQSVNLYNSGVGDKQVGGPACCCCCGCWAGGGAC
jgi:ABC-type Na+ transport system ATPase subunit NatA